MVLPSVEEEASVEETLGQALTALGQAVGVQAYG